MKINNMPHIPSHSACKLGVRGVCILPVLILLLQLGKINACVIQIQISSVIPVSSWSITDISGRLIQQGIGKIIDLSAHPSGLYLAAIKTGDGRISSHKIIRE